MVGSFYVSFMLLVSLVLLNVVIAVLLEAFGKASSEESANIFVVVGAEGDKIVIKGWFVFIFLCVEFVGRILTANYLPNSIPLYR